jgi:hypothetical protein
VKNTLMSGFWRYMLAVPPILWEKQIQRARMKIERNLSFMTPAHREVHHFAVRELPRAGVPLSPEAIAGALGMTTPSVIALLNDLESHMTFLYRNEAGAVTWAYPVTVTPTPHRVTFSSGERVYAA